MHHGTCKEDNGCREGFHLKTGIALLGTGGAGAFSIGVLKALEELGIAPQFIAASGSAAFPAVLYASGCSIEELKPLYTYYYERAGRNHFIQALWNRLGRKDSLQRYVEDQLSGLGVCTVREAQKPLALMMTDLISGREVLIAPLEKSRSDELDIDPDLPLSEVLCACGRGMRVVTRGTEKAKLCPLSGRRAYAFWALRRMGAEKVLGVREKIPKKEAVAAKRKETLSQALELAQQAQGRLERMTPSREDAVIFIPEDLQANSIDKAVEAGYRTVMQWQETLYDALLFDQETSG